MHPGERWKGFPHVSAFYRGNDGIPFDVDNLTIPFTKWRSESLKAYGNAIVPQVMYQIMKVINDISTNN
jgi:DNA (cytosine-5)-methyltransferase 1